MMKAAFQVSKQKRYMREAKCTTLRLVNTLRRLSITLVASLTIGFMDSVQLRKLGIEDGQ